MSQLEFLHSFEGFSKLGYGFHHPKIADAKPGARESYCAMNTVVVLLIAVALVVFVFYWSGRHGDRNRSRGTSLRRGPNAHTTLRGRAKIGYAKREDAEAQAHSMTKRDGASMSVYQCGTCAKWHVGHV